MTGDRTAVPPTETLHKFKPPFEIYHEGTEIGDQDGHVCTAESAPIAQALVTILNDAGGLER